MSTTLGVETERLLRNYDVSKTQLEEIRGGSLTWDVFGNSEPDDPLAAAVEAADRDHHTLILLDPEGGTQPIRKLTAAQADELVDVAGFESRPNREGTAEDAFPPGELQEWAGIQIDSHWSGLVDSYVEAALTIGNGLRGSRLTSPYLFLCRHALELQLKAIVVLGQRAFGLAEDLPAHHNLARLWTAAYPFVHDLEDKGPSFDKAREFVAAFHEADPQSHAFRYPVTKNNVLVTYAEDVKVFEPKAQRENFSAAIAELRKAIRSLRFRAWFRRSGGLPNRGKTTGKSK